MSGELQALIDRLGPAALQAAQPTITLDTNLSPSVVLYDEGAPPMQASPLVRWLQPTVRFDTEYGSEVIAPHGVASQDLSPFVKAAAVVVVGLALFGAVSLIR